ncbi:alpha/beta hydrolase [Jeotgalicoccus meleagridis]|uniref:Acetylxylan esterase n=1 Tax=Jeotgalicoccus meleagridis TaxID=2759181 RepID=A0A6V7RG21_9STAP|nr:alpha/beta hydrolase [Jeotgalicoccus meleagridis]CAD2076673.1 Acetylxylan esterase precursor [Jeotgalicoccus meleagridis]
MKIKKFKIGDYHAEVTAILGETGVKFEKKPAIVICPGGSYMYVSKRESEAVAYDFLKRGYQVFILNYSTIGTMIEREGRQASRDELYQIASMVEDDRVLGSEFPNPLIELALTFAHIREHIHEYNVDSDNIGVIGFSAGGHLAASLSVHWNTDWLSDLVGKEARWFRPNFQVLAYPILDYELNGEIAKERGVGDPIYMSMASRMVFGAKIEDDILDKATLKNHVSSDTPKTFIWHTVGDRLVYVKNALDFADALEKAGVPWEIHTFNKGDHGLSVASEITGTVNTHVQKWIPLMFEWLEGK